MTDNSNNNKNFVFVQGKTKNIFVKFPASTEIEEGSAIYPANNGTGTYIIADGTAGQEIGIIRQTIKSTDINPPYDEVKEVPMEVPLDIFAELEFAVGAGTFTAADVGKTVDLHTDGKSIAVDTDTKKQFLITGYISATRGLGRFLGGGRTGLPLTT